MVRRCHGRAAPSARAQALPLATQPRQPLDRTAAKWDSADGRWQLRAGVRNLTDEVYKTDGQEFSSVGNIQTAYYGAPRNVRVGVDVRF